MGNATHQGQQNFGNTYNPNWRNHPNFSWGGNQAQNTNQYKGPVQPNPQPVQNNQLGQIAGSQNTRPQGVLPSDTEANPKQVNAVTTRSGLQTKEMVKDQGNSVVTDDSLQENAEVEDKEKRLVKRFNVSKYTKYLKDIVANKNWLTEYATVAFTQKCTSKIQNKLPTKLKDPESFTLQITFGQTIYARGLCDLGASINLMPTSWYQKMGLGSSKPTTIVLQLADRSLARPDGVIEDVLVQVGSLIFLVDFVILDFEVDPIVPFILG
ncbi:uncharacterized protein LOC107841476 [Capsicum annuum]|uniref:uncharacterized protein LOC107841476 n=1 Tax=Capsicum annuum TaxID=4072 RepID=UPI0007BEC24F|nr:uncharacterized protein LOC107841476 [Capsicum annuum]